MTRRVLAIFAHPDDESLLAGGTLAACAAAGADVAVVCLTRGEQGPIANPDLATRETLGDTRERELSAAAAALGVGRVDCLAYPDGELDGLNPTPISEDLTRRMSEVRPDIVITFGPEGWYWHPDHVAVHYAVMAAIETLRVDAAPSVYYATSPRGEMQTLQAALDARGLPAELWGLDPEHFGVRASRITTTIDVRSYLAAKLHAVRCHRTQLSADHLYRVMPDDLASDFLGREHFVRARAGAATGDPLADLAAAAAQGCATS